MPLPTTQPELAKIFQKLGANDPQGWASSEINEGIPQLLRFLILKQITESISPTDSTDWIESEINNALKFPDAPYAGLGHGLEQCLKLGVSKEDLTEIARCLKMQTAFFILSALEGADQELEEVSEIDWGIFQIDADGNPLNIQAGGLHESVLEFDPEGREMRPKPRG